MPRDSNGVYSLPAGYLATTGETVLPSQHNPPLEDLAAAMSGSMPRNGAAPMTGPFKAISGTASAPGFTFNSEPGSGLFLKSAGVIGIAIGGAEVGTIAAGGLSGLAADAVETAAIDDKAVTYAKIQDVAHGKLLGRVTADAGVVEEITIALGQCRLAKSGSNLVLSPFRGNRITINSLLETIPDVGVSLTPSGLTPSTLYFIYAYMNAGTMTLEASATAYATQAATGVAIKSGDATRTLVGMARPITGPAWQDTVTQRFVRSYFNDPGSVLINNFTTNRSTSSTSAVELNSEIRIEFLSWSGECVQVFGQGNCSNTHEGRHCYSLVSFDGVSTATWVSVQAPLDGGGFGFSCSSVSSSLSQGYHYATLLGFVSNNTGTWDGTTRLSGLLRNS